MMRGIERVDAERIFDVETRAEGGKVARTGQRAKSRLAEQRGASMPGTHHPPRQSNLTGLNDPAWPADKGDAGVAPAAAGIEELGTRGLS